MSADTIALLTSIDASLRKLVAIAESRRQKQPSVDLDGPHGDPTVKAKDPRDWTGEPQQGKRFSECPPEYLEMVAERLDYFNAQLGDSDEDKKKRKFNTLDAARARGWAERLRAGWTAPERSSDGW